jgi:ribosome maturation protein Sdo1
MFQFQGGVSDSDKEKILSELLKQGHVTIGANNRVQYPEQA